MGVEPQVLQCLFRTGDKSAKRAKRLRKRAVSKRKIFLDPEFLGRPATVIATAQDRVCFVDEHSRAMLLGHRDQSLEIPEVAIHRINSFDNDELAAAPLP